MGGLKGADRSANPGEVSTGATGGSEARSEPREPSVSGAFKPFSSVLDSDPTVQYYSEQDRHD